MSQPHGASQQPDYGAPQQPGYGVPQQPDYGVPQPGYGAAQQPAYGVPQQPGYGGYMAPAEHPQASTVQILGIIGIVVGICSFIAWFMGAQAKKEIEAGAPYPFDGKLKLGYTLGKVFSIIYIVLFVIYILVIILGVVAVVTSS